MWVEEPLMIIVTGIIKNPENTGFTGSPLLKWQLDFEVYPSLRYSTYLCHITVSSKDIFENTSWLHFWYTYAICF